MLVFILKLDFILLVVWCVMKMLTVIIRNYYESCVVKTGTPEQQAAVQEAQDIRAAKAAAFATGMVIGNQLWNSIFGK